MKIHVVIAQRKCKYEDEYAPECLAVMSECSHDDNPDYLHDVITENRASGDFDAVEIVTIEVDSDAVDAALFPNRNPIPAKIVPTPNKL